MIRRRWSTALYQFCTTTYVSLHRPPTWSHRLTLFLSQPAGSALCCLRKAPLSHVIEILLPEVGVVLGMMRLVSLDSKSFTGTHISRSIKIEISGQYTIIAKWTLIYGHCHHMSRSDYHSSFQNDQSQQWAGERVYTEERCSQNFFFANTFSVSQLQLIPGDQAWHPKTLLWITDSDFVIHRAKCGSTDPNENTQSRVFSIHFSESLSSVKVHERHHQISACAWRVNVWIFLWFTPGRLLEGDTSWDPRGKVRLEAGWNGPWGRPQSCQ